MRHPPCRRILPALVGWPVRLPRLRDEVFESELRRGRETLFDLVVLLPQQLLYSPEDHHEPVLTAVPVQIFFEQDGTEVRVTRPAVSGSGLGAQAVTDYLVSVGEILLELGYQPRGEP